MSLKCMIAKWLYKGQISQEEYDAVIKKLDGHDSELLDKVAERIKGRWLFRGTDGNPYRDTVDNVIEEMKVEVCE